MKYIRIDETKLSSVMEIVEQAAELMSEKDCNNDEKAKLDLEKFQQELNGNALVVCTGRIPGAVRSACTTSMHYQQNLILRGLLLIYRKNSR